MGHQIPQGRPTTKDPQSPVACIASAKAGLHSEYKSWRIRIRRGVHTLEMGYTEGNKTKQEQKWTLQLGHLVY